MSALDARWSITAVATFEASHRLQGSARCFRDHGHHWTAEVTVTAPEMERDGIPRGAEGLEAAWNGLIDELDHRPLDEMLPGVVNSVQFTPPENREHSVGEWRTFRIYSLRGCRIAFDKRPLTSNQHIIDYLSLKHTIVG